MLIGLRTLSRYPLKGIGQLRPGANQFDEDGMRISALPTVLGAESADRGGQVIPGFHRNLEFFVLQFIRD